MKASCVSSVVLASAFRPGSTPFLFCYPLVDGGVMGIYVVCVNGVRGMHSIVQHSRRQ